MNKLQFKGEWHEFKGKLRQKFADLTDDDLAYTQGQEEELLGHLQKKLGKSQQEITQLINTP
ncbi:CsbD family protein [Cyanobium sp. Lug-B]|uniref:CsbD family protein n=1 Tax=Cyanobium sp. Lug-B TaxID=2823716 RepID=UPI0020CDE26D|nr:CsbD family protein [Cyanobium sp. Lug-B]MCP9797791.1 CsbD family protein [Cyanobium sp. Lug-B]